MKEFNKTLQYAFTNIYEIFFFNYKNKVMGLKLYHDHLVVQKSNLIIKEKKVFWRELGQKRMTGGGGGGLNETTLARAS